MLLAVLHHYVFWHYTTAFGEIFHVWKNLIWFTINFFSIPQMLRSYFSPWKRMTENRGNTFNFEDLAGFIIINLISRIIGMILRTIVIFLGTLALVFLITAIIVTYIFWLCAPLLLIACLYFGLILIFS